MGQCQLLLESAGSRAERKAAEWVWLCEGCVAPPIQEIMLAVAWVVLYSGLVECGHEGAVF